MAYREVFELILTRFSLLKWNVFEASSSNKAKLGVGLMVRSRFNILASESGLKLEAMPSTASIAKNACSIPRRAFSESPCAVIEMTVFIIIFDCWSGVVCRGKARKIAPIRVMNKITHSNRERWNGEFTAYWKLSRNSTFCCCITTPGSRGRSSATSASALSTWIRGFATASFFPDGAYTAASVL